jgi:hypothetical protein
MIETSVKPFVFVLMPFHPDFNDIYQLGIKAACQAAGAYCERVDEQIFVEDILDRVYNQIAKADIIISEMTGRNPNVFYETGYAYALNKRVILLTQITDDIPFDLKHYPHIVYGGKITELKSELEKKVRWCIDNPTKSIPSTDQDLELSINGHIWQDGLHILCKEKIAPAVSLLSDIRFQDLYSNFGSEYGSCFQLELYNISSRIIDGSKYRLGLVGPNNFRLVQSLINEVNNFRYVQSRISEENKPYHELMDGNRIIKMNGRIIFPGDTERINIYIFWEAKVVAHSSYKFTLRLFHEFGTKDYSFNVTFD